MRETIKLTLRGYKLWWEIIPGYLIAMTLHGIVSALAPYVGIFLTAQIINEIAGARDQDRLTRLVLAALISAAVLGLLEAALNRWKKYHKAAEWQVHESIFAKKLISMDFRDVDSTLTRERLSQVLQNTQWGNWGLRRLQSIFEMAVTGLFKIIGALALSVSLFTLPVPENAGWLTILNNPLFIVLIIFMLMVVTFISPMLSGRANSYWYKCHEELKLGNRFFVFFAFFCQQRERAMDVRMYQQEQISKHYNIDNMGVIFGPKGKMAKIAR